MIIAALLIGTLAFIAAYSAFILHRGNMIGLLLIIMSIAGIFFVIFPNETNIFANALGVGRGADLLLYICFMAGVLLIFLVHIKFRQQSILITELARAVAINEALGNEKSVTADNAAPMIPSSRNG